MAGKILGKEVKEWLAEFPLLEEVMAKREVFWINPASADRQDNAGITSIGERDLREAEARLDRFAPYIMKAFPETTSDRGIIESPLTEVPVMQTALEKLYLTDIPGRMFIKEDNCLPIAGSIKARGGIYEVLCHAEQLALGNKLLSPDDDYSVLAEGQFKNFFSNYGLSVGSTGNLGISVGIVGAKMGFKTYVHMSADAREWKKKLLRNSGVTVFEYKADFSHAVEEGRKQAENDPSVHFVDDENSRHLFLGYAAGVRRLEMQLREKGIAVDDKHPLFVYLPCGVGGSPGGITFGLNLVCGSNVHCFFAEPVSSPCMLLGLMTEEHDRVSVYDFGLDNATAADGLAVARPSGFAGELVSEIVGGIYTLADDRLFEMLTLLADTENINIEPSAAAGIVGPVRLLTSTAGRQYLQSKGLEEKLNNAAHLAWSTGGGLVPAEIMQQYYEKGQTLLEKM